MRRFFQGSWAAWDKLYQAELFEGLRFPIGEINEDEAIAVCLLERSNRVCYTNEIFYHYLRRPESITTASFHPKKLVWVQHCWDNMRLVEITHPELVSYAAARYHESLLWALRELCILGYGMEDAWHMLRRELRAQIHGMQKNLFRALLLAYLPRKWLKVLFVWRMNHK